MRLIMINTPAGNAADFARTAFSVEIEKVVRAKAVIVYTLTNAANIALNQMRASHRFKNFRNPLNTEKLARKRFFKEPEDES